MATIAIGTCAAFGGLPAAAPEPDRRAVGVADAVPGVKNLINLSACPANVENLTALDRLLPDLQALAAARLATAGRSSPTASRSTTTASGARTSTPGSTSRPGATRATATGYCLYKMGCKGPVTFQNCPNVRWNGGTNWPIGCGHPCIGCAEPDFWDKMTPFYQHLPGSRASASQSNIDTRRPLGHGRRRRRLRGPRRDLAGQTLAGRAARPASARRVRQEAPEKGDRP